MSNAASFTQIENKEDLQCLIRGDNVKIIFQNEPLSKYGEEDPVIGAIMALIFEEL